MDLLEKSPGVRLPRTVVFIDYEHWYYGMLNQHHEKPDVNWLITDIKKHGKIDNIFVFADFTKEGINQEKDELRLMTSNIIDCSNPNPYKEMADFVMLDHIYGYVLQNPGVEQYILVTGDSHFHSVVVRLRTNLDKAVGIYGVEGAFAQLLRRSASWTEEIKPQNPQKSQNPEMNNPSIINMVIQNLRWAETRGVIPSFSKTVDAVTNNAKVDRDKVVAALENLLEKEYIHKEVIKHRGFDITRLVIDWERLKKDNVWDYEKPVNGNHKNSVDNDVA